MHGDLACAVSGSVKRQCHMRTCHDASPRYFSILHDIPIDPMATASLQIQLHHQQSHVWREPTGSWYKDASPFHGHWWRISVLGSAQAMIVRWDLGAWTLVSECRLLLSYMINLPGYANAALPNFSFLEACRRKTLHFFFPCFFVVLLPVCKRCCSHKQPSTCKEAPGRSLTQEWNFARQSQSN